MRSQGNALCKAFHIECTLFNPWGQKTRPPVFTAVSPSPNYQELLASDTLPGFQTLYCSNIHPPEFSGHFQFSSPATAAATRKVKKLVHLYSPLFLGLSAISNSSPQLRFSAFETRLRQSAEGPSVDRTGMRPTIYQRPRVGADRKQTPPGTVTLRLRGSTHSSSGTIRLKRPSA